MNGKRLIPEDSADTDSTCSESWMDVGARVSSSKEQPQDEESGSVNLRPQSFNEYTGQEQIKEALQIAVGACKRRGEPLDHVLLSGPPGLGKTSLARIIASEMGANLKSTSGPVIEKPGDLAAILTGLDAHDVLFIDEIHRLPRVVEEVLYPAMEDYELDILIGSGPAAKSIKIALKPFTLIGATTRTGLLTSPLRDRFGLAFRLNFYQPEQLRLIVERSSRLLGLCMPEEASTEIGRRARGTPRIANRILRRVRDYSQERAQGKVTAAIVRQALELLEIDGRGLDPMDRNILNTIIDRFHGGPVGVDTIAAAIGEDRDTIEDVYEPFLLQEGFIARTKRGREITSLGLTHCGKDLPQRPQINLELD